VPTLYDLIGVEPDASTADIRAARRRTLMTVHPDHATTTGLDEQRLAARTKAVIDACAILTDPGRRAEYDVAVGIARSRRLRRLRLTALDSRTVGPSTWPPLPRRGSAARPAVRSATVRLSLPAAHVPRPAARAGRLLYETRVGQWLLVGLSAVAAQAVTLTLALSAGIDAGAVLVVGVVLARGGAPTPLSDGRAIGTAVARALVRAGRTLIALAR